VIFEFDPDKDKLNQAKHGFSLSLAESLEWDDALVSVDETLDYDEIRMRGIVPLGERLYFVAFVDRAEIRRPFSLRLAERREVKHYVENYR
jgi:uncharacterized DUF497 family protein